MNSTIAPPRLEGEVLRVSEVHQRDREQMFSLMNQYYANVRQDAFDSDFDSKHWVIVARCPANGKVAGFSTQWFGDYTIEGDSIGVLYSGDTIIDRQYWSRNPLASLWGRLALQLIDRNPTRTLVWFLISKGYKTYRYLPVFFKEFYPNPAIPTPKKHQRILDHVAKSKFAHRYLQSRGVIAAEPNGCRLRESVADVTKQRLRDDFIRYFNQVNPGHASGDELCCIAPLTRNNFNDAAYRMISRHVDTPRGGQCTVSAADFE